MNQLTRAIVAAHRGFRRDVQVLIEALDQSELLIPLSHSMGEVPYGESIELDQELTLLPHMLVDPEGKLYAAMFSEAGLLEPAKEELGWTTEERALEYCTLAAPAAIEMALSVIDDERVVGLVLNPLDASELVLRRDEVASIAQRRALPLVGYVSSIPAQEFEQTLVAEPGELPPSELIQALEACLGELSNVGGYALRHTFNPERDLEPHLTVHIALREPSADRKAIAESIVSAIGSRLPPPGYIDILFDEPQN